MIRREEEKNRGAGEMKKETLASGITLTVNNIFVSYDRLLVLNIPFTYNFDTEKLKVRSILYRD